MSSRLKLAGIVLLGSFALAACGGGGGGTADTTPPPPAANPAEERSAIQMALNAAGQALSVVTAAGENATDTQIMDAETKVAQAKAAIAAADDLSDAEIAQHNTALGLIETPLMAARAAFDEAQRVADVGSARSAALQSYMDADADAKKARLEADAAEETAPGSAGAMAAETAAVEARRAADAAKAAHDAIMDDMTKAEADVEKGKAASAAETAMGHYLTAMRENNTIQTAATAAGEQERKSAVATAKLEAGKAAMAAMTAKNEADEAATAAETARDNAKAAYDKAMAARTDMATARAEYEKAKAAAMDARTAATEANDAYMAAKMAAEGIDDAGTAAAAQTAQGTAEDQQGIAVARQGTAEGHQSTAEMAETAAVTAAGTHVLTLFKAANGEHVMDVESTEADERAAHVASVGAAMAAIAAATNGNQAASTTVTASWLGDTVDDPATDADESVERSRPTITVTVAGTTAITVETRESKAAMDLNNDGDMTDPGEPRIIQTATKIADLGVFQGYDLWEDDGDATTNTDRARAILFTNLQKGEDSKLAVTGGAARSVNNQATPAASELSTVRSTGSTITGVTWTPSGEPPLMGTLTCPANTACNIVLGDDGAVTTITGYTFTGSRAAVTAVTAADAMENTNYLAFGLWLEESDDGATDTFGAFAVGGTGYAVGPVIGVTGTAMYSGKAAGAHHKTGEGVNWFHGDASLTANFGDATEAGTISGRINNIRVAGGDPMSAPIYLGQAALTGGTATFNGAAFMGAATAPGASTHEFDGTWSGSFFGPTVNDPDTADVDESVTAPLAAAGTFGVTKSMGTGDDRVVESFVGAFGAHKQ